jgi:hypothetical protein
MNIMQQFIVASTALALFATTGVNGAEPAPTLAKQLEPLRPFIGKTWKGPFRSSTPEKPVHDVAKWERAMNGQAVRVLHSINDGKYGGESIIMWNRKTERLEFYYFTTAGFFTQGTIHVEGNKLISHEIVTGSDEGITEVKATTELLRDGRMQSKSRYLKKGEWVDGRSVTYQVTPDAEVIFK